MSGALIRFVAAVGALGGGGINLALRQSYVSTWAETSAFWVFLASYIVASVVTWMMYVRRPVSVGAVPGPKAESTHVRPTAQC